MVPAASGWNRTTSDRGACLCLRVSGETSGAGAAACRRGSWVLGHPGPRGRLLALLSLYSRTGEELLVAAGNRTRLRRWHEERVLSWDSEAARPGRPRPRSLWSRSSSPAAVTSSGSCPHGRSTAPALADVLASKWEGLFQRQGWRPRVPFIFYFYFFILCFLGPHPHHVEVPRLGVQSEL